MENYNYNISSMDSHAIEREQQAFLTKVYTWMVAGLGMTGVTAFWAFSSNILPQIGGWYTGLIIAELALVFILSGAINRMSSAVASILFIAYSVLTGITFSAIAYVYTIDSIMNVFFITAGSFAALSFYGFVTKKNLSGMGSFMIMGLFGIIIASVVNIFVGSSMLSTIIALVGVIVFAGLTAYDTQRLKEMALGVAGDQELASKGAIIGALSLYLNFINLFLMLLRLLGNRD